MGLPCVGGVLCGFGEFTFGERSFSSEDVVMLVDDVFSSGFPPFGVYEDYAVSYDENMVGVGVGVAWLFDGVYDGCVAVFGLVDPLVELFGDELFSEDACLDVGCAAYIVDSPGEAGGGCSEDVPVVGGLGEFCEFVDDVFGDVIIGCGGFGVHTACYRSWSLLRGKGGVPFLGL